VTHQCHPYFSLFARATLLRTYIRLLGEGESPILHEEKLTPEEKARERIVFGLRMIDGIDLAQFETETGFSADRLCGTPIQRYLDMGMLHREGSRLRLTTDGLLVSDAMWPDFLEG
jgi:oxygen-independent coproporphyrinogen III oxidase